VVEIRNGEITIANRGDAGAVFWNGSNYPNRRNPTQFPQNVGGPSAFQLQTVPHNVAYSLRGTEYGQITGQLDVDPNADQIFSMIGGEERDKPESLVTIPRGQLNTDYIILMSDGARLNGELLEPTNSYHQSVDTTMRALRDGKITMHDAARRIAECARDPNIGSGPDLDDIAVQIIDVRDYVSSA